MIQFSLQKVNLDDLFSASINSGNLYQSLIGNYNKAIQEGNFEQSFDTLETTLPSVEQLEASILAATVRLTKIAKR